MMTVLRIGIALLHVSVVSARVVLPSNNSTAVTDPVSVLAMFVSRNVTPQRCAANTVRAAA